MSINRLAFLAAMVCAFSFQSGDVCSQNISVSTPFNSVNDSYYENTGVSWGFRSGIGTQSQVFGNFGGGVGGGAVPPFGGYDPGADATFGFINRDPAGNGFSLGLRMGKGSSRTMTSNSPSVVTQNGGTGAIFDGALRPFVTGVIPVVGDNTYMGNPNSRILGPAVSGHSQPPAQFKDVSEVFQVEDQEKEPRQRTSPPAPRHTYSSAQVGDISVAEIKRQRERQIHSENQELQSLIDDAKKFEEAGDFIRARIRYVKASKKADGQLRYELKLKTEELKQKIRR